MRDDDFIAESDYVMDAASILKCNRIEITSFCIKVQTRVAELIWKTMKMYLPHIQALFNSEMNQNDEHGMTDMDYAYKFLEKIKRRIGDSIHKKTGVFISWNRSCFLCHYYKFCSKCPIRRCDCITDNCYHTIALYLLGAETLSNAQKSCTDIINAIHGVPEDVVFTETPSQRCRGGHIE